MIFVFSLTLRTALLMANRTFVRLGALTGACAALRIAAAVCIAGYYARVKPAVQAGCARPGADAALRNRIRDAFPRPKGGEPPPVAAATAPRPVRAPARN